MASPQPTLIATVFARLPLFDGLDAGAVERLSAAGFGRGLLSASLRARLRRAGFSDMGALARATPAALMSVRKIGPVRVAAIRAHILDDLARFSSQVRDVHGAQATARRRIDRLRALPEEQRPLAMAEIEEVGHAGAALTHRTEDSDGRVSALVAILLATEPHQRSASARENDTGENADRARDHADIVRERDREWDEADPARQGRARDRP